MENRNLAVTNQIAPFVTSIQLNMTVCHTHSLFTTILVLTFIQWSEDSHRDGRVTGRRAIVATSLIKLLIIEYIKPHRLVVALCLV